MFAPVQGLLEYARRLGFGPILVPWQSNLWGVSATLRFVASGTDLPAFLLYLKTAFFEAHLLSSYKTWQLCSPKSYNVFIEPSYTIATSYLITWTHCEVFISGARQRLGRPHSPSTFAFWGILHLLRLHPSPRQVLLHAMKFLLDIIVGIPRKWGLKVKYLPLVPPHSFPTAEHDEEAWAPNVYSSTYAR